MSSKSVRKFERLIQSIKDTQTIEPTCTCKEDSKQRALCPVCDKDEYERMMEVNFMASMPIDMVHNEPRSRLEEKKKQLSADFNFENGKVSLTVHNHNASFDEVEVFMIKLKEEIDRQLDHKEDCPFFKKYKCI